MPALAGGEPGRAGPPVGGQRRQAAARARPPAPPCSAQPRLARSADSRSLRRQVCGKRGELAGPAPRPPRGAVPVGTTRLARPMPSASAASTGRPVRIRSSARLGADQPRQPDRAAVDQRHAPAPAEDAEDGVLLGDPQVAPERELETARDGVALDRGDHRLATAASGSGPSGRRRPPRRGCRARCRPPSGRRRRRTCRRRRTARRPRRPGRRRRRGRRRRARAAVGPSTALRRCGRSRTTVVTGPSRSTRTDARPLTAPPTAGRAARGAGSCRPPTSGRCRRSGRSWAPCSRPAGTVRRPAARPRRPRCRA